jgi:hypothetical protein
MERWFSVAKGLILLLIVAVVLIYQAMAGKP